MIEYGLHIYGPGAFKGRKSFRISSSKTSIVDFHYLSQLRFYKVVFPVLDLLLKSDLNLFRNS